MPTTPVIRWSDAAYAAVHGQEALAVRHLDFDSAQPTTSELVNERILARMAEVLGAGNTAAPSRPLWESVLRLYEQMRVAQPFPVKISVRSEDCEYFASLFEPATWPQWKGTPIPRGIPVIRNDGVAPGHIRLREAGRDYDIQVPGLPSGPKPWPPRWYLKPEGN
jgi:hypothetical protein